MSRNIAHKLPHGSFLSLCMIICAYMASASGASAQEIAKPPRVKSPYTSCLTANRVAITNFTITPAEAKPGDTVMVEMTIKNMCPAGTDPLKNIFWELTKDDLPFRTGSIQSLEAGASTTITSSTVGDCRRHRIDVFVDPFNRLYEREQARADNSTWGEYSSLSRIVSRELRHIDIQTFAQFTFGQMTPPKGCTWSSPPESGGPPDRVAFKIRCAGILGAKNSFTGFRLITLRGGWKVKSVDDEKFIGGNAGFSWEKKPSQGSSDPSMKLNLWADAFSAIEVRVRIIIEGPECENPIEEGSRP